MPNNDEPPPPPPPQWVRSGPNFGVGPWLPPSAGFRPADPHADPPPASLQPRPDDRPPAAFPPRVDPAEYYRRARDLAAVAIVVAVAALVLGLIAVIVAVGS